MLTLAGSIIGFLISFLPKVMDFFQDWQDKRHELALMKEQREAVREIAMVMADSAAEQARYRHDEVALERSWRWIASLSASVRPVTTYWFVGLFVLTKGAVLLVFLLEAWLLYTTARKAGTIFVESIMAGSQHLSEALPLIWDSPTMALFATIMSFWFGDRCRKKAFGK